MKRNTAEDADAKRQRALREGVLVYHTKSPDATLQSVLAAAGIVRLTGPVPPWKLFEEDEAESPGGSQESQER